MEHVAFRIPIRNTKQGVIVIAVFEHELLERIPSVAQLQVH